MNKKFKRIYIEILNYCNLNCSFCVKTTKPKKMITINEFSYILDEIKPYTDYIYLHVQGEPLLHPHINEFIDIAYDKGFSVNITTNATLLTDSFDHSKIRQLNISLQAIINNEKYYDNIISLIKRNKNTYISLRLWGNFDNDKVLSTIKYFEDRLNTKIIDNGKSKKLTDHVFFSLEEEFTWPSLSLPFQGLNGTCQGTISHVAILASGEVVPCCLDKDGIINLGNIYNQSFASIINSPRFILMNKGFKDHQITEELCQRCSYRNRVSV